ncbi:MAG: hypothetical protein JXR12_01220 [Neptunomonas phycophila]|uniref:hypothetical protein n=1 Tax=Neptunomonas phycophila TaxID=1572645 RepID=UPI003B8D9514
MSLLNDLYQDVRSSINWGDTDNHIKATFGNSVVTFECVEDQWIVNPVLIETDKDISTTVKDMIASFLSKHQPQTLLIESDDASVRNIFEYAFNAVRGMYNYNMDLFEHTIVLGEQVEILEEEPNSSLMYHRMFPDKKLNAELESYGYKFRDGSGLKLMRKTMGSTNRNSRPHERRTMQSIIIFKDGSIFRKIAKQKWNQLVDPSDSQSVSWGVAFQRKMVAAERKLRQEQGIEIHFK